MRRTLTLGALATAGCLRLDTATAFQLPLTTRPRPAGVLRPTSFSATPASRHEDPRPRVASLSMVVDGTKPGGAAPEAPTQDAAPAVDAAAPEGTDAPTDDVAHAAKDDTASVEGGKVGKIEGKEEVEKVVSAAPAVVAGAGVPAAVAAVPKAKPVVAKKKKEEEPTDESSFSSLEQAFAEARRRSLAQAGDKKPAPASKPAVEASAVAGTKVAEPAASKAPATAAKPAASAKPAAAVAAKATTPVAAKPPAKAAPKPSAAVAPQAAKPVAKAPVAAAPIKSEGVKARTTAGQVKKAVPVKGSPPKEAAVVKIKTAASATKEAPKTDDTKPKAAKKAEAVAEEDKGGPFSFGAESLEEFFGLTKKPRLVSSTTPPSDNAAPASPMAELDSKAVDNMIAESGLNEVTLKEDFRKMEADAKAAQVSGKAPPAAAAAKKPVAAPAKKTDAGAASNPFGALTSLLNMAPAPAPGTKKKESTPAPAPAKPVAAKAVASKPKVAPKKAAPAPKAAAPSDAGETESMSDGGLGGLLEGMFGAPVYDDEVDTLPQKQSSSPRAMPVFAPPPAPAKAPSAPVASPPKAAALASNKSSAPSPPSFLDGLFGAKSEESPKKAPAPVAAKKVAPPAPAAPVKKQAPAPSMLEGLFGGGDKKKSSAAAAAAPPQPKSPSVAAKKAAAPVASKKAPTPVAAKKAPAPSPFAGLFGGAKEKAAPTPAPVPAPVPAPKKAAPAPAPTPFNLFGGMGGGDAAKSSPAKKAAAPAPKNVAPVAEKKAPSSGGGGMFDFLGGAQRKSEPVVPEPEPEPVKAASGNPFASLFGSGGASGGGGAAAASKPATKAGVKSKAKPKPKPKRQPAPTPPAPTPAVSRVKTMDDSFLRKVSVMLRRNQAKIKKFQQLTDRFRGGLIKAPAYYAGVEELFGEENVEEIIGPLLAALPENDKRKTLQDVYSKAQKAKNGSADSAQGGGLTGLFGWGSKPATKAPAAAAAPKKAAGRGGAAAGGAEPYAFAEAKLSAADFQVFKTRTALFARGGINARNYYDTLVKVFGSNGVKQQLPALLNALPANKRKLVKDVFDGLNK